MKRDEVVAIPVTIGTDYVVDLRRRLELHGISNREICQLIGWQETAFSRLFRPLENGKARTPGVDTAAMIEQAIHTILARRERERRKAASKQNGG